MGRVLAHAPLAAADSALQSMAERHGVTSGQIALAWLLHRAPHIIPIPGTTSLKHLEENMAATRVILSEAEVRELSEPSLYAAS